MGVAGPFDPIDIPGDIQAIHFTPASKLDSVSIIKIERCLKIVTDFSAKRKEDMIETITVAMSAERDARTAKSD